MTRKRDSFGEINLPSSQPMLLRIGPLYGEDADIAESSSEEYISELLTTALLKKEDENYEWTIVR